MRTSKLILIASLLFTMTGCSLNITGSTKTGGGVYKSYDRAVTWENKSSINSADPKSKNQASLTATDSLLIIADHRDARKLYLGTKAHGLFMSDNAGDGWLQIIKSGRVGGIAIDPYIESTIYASVNNKIVKTTNGGGNWRVLYTEGRNNVTLTTMTIDPYDASILYAGTSSGEVIKSDDLGVNWRVILNAGSPIKKILVNLKDSNMVYVATSTKGIFKTSNKGANWINLLDKIWTDRVKKRELKGANVYHNMIADTSKQDSILLVTDYGLFRTDDGGNTWQNIQLVTSPRDKPIYSIAIDPKNPNYIYYGTSTAFYRSEDGGKTWSSLKPVSSKAVVALLIDENTPNIIYAATAAVKEEEKITYN